MQSKQDSAAINELLTRGVDTVYPSADALQEVLESGKKLRIYNGIDPTADTLHIGHLTVLQKLRQFQDLGHEVIMLIGDFTGMIGDPTGKSKTRVQLTRAQVRANAKRYKEQAGAVLARGFTVRRNGEWWDKVSAQQLLETLSLTTVQRLLERDMFQERMREGKPISAHEFIYPVLQGYDSVAMEVDVEIGGTDQTFNMLMGRDYVRKMQEREKFVITVPLLTDASGKKIGKSEGNMVELGVAAAELYGQAMALPDGVIVPCFVQCTSVPMEEVDAIITMLKDGANPRDLKMRLARELVRMRYGVKDADKAQEAFVKTFQKHEMPEEMTSVPVKRGKWNILDLLVVAALVPSKAEARRVVQQRGVKVDGSIMSDISAVVVVAKDGVLIQKGKRHFVRVVAK
ncbi:MAG: tyrosine--tRNA ligase [bacterium]|nr:tyrosine--tRNA ligase [bacterium]